MNRDIIMESLSKEEIWDIIIIGGGASGLGAAVDATSRGFKTLLLEQVDFAKGTSSRSTKLVHGGVRYLAQGNISLVLEALRERGLLKQNAPHLVQDQSFVVPSYKWWEGTYYTVGLKLYDVMAGKLSLGSSVHISKKETLKYIPELKQEGLTGGIVYHDGQFDDSRLSVNLAQTVYENGGFPLNYMKVTALSKDSKGKINGVKAIDKESSKEFEIKGKVVINATGVFVDNIIQMDNPDTPKTVRPSQGIHIVLDRKFLDTDYAIMIPKTEDGRVLFAVPWHNRVVVGTTDTMMDDIALEPKALESEIDFILQNTSAYMTTQPQKSDIKSVFAGLRPLAAPQQGGAETKEISRSHKIHLTPSQLVTIIGGKWTTYRQMAEEVIDLAITLLEEENRPSVTKKLPIHGYMKNTDYKEALYFYGTDKVRILNLMKTRPELNEMLSEELHIFKGQVIWAVREEMARTVEDVLARRTRALFLDAKESIRMAPETARLMAVELGHDDVWQKEQVEAFTQLAETYLPS